MYVFIVLVCVCYWKCAQLLNVHLQNAGIEESTTACIHTWLPSAQIERKLGGSPPETYLLSKMQIPRERQKTEEPQIPAPAEFMFKPGSSDLRSYSQLRSGCICRSNAGRKGGQEKQLLRKSWHTVISSGLGDRVLVTGFSTLNSQSVWLTHRTVPLSPPWGGRGRSRAILWSKKWFYTRHLNFQRWRKKKKKRNAKQQRKVQG